MQKLGKGGGGGGYGIFIFYLSAHPTPPPPHIRCIMGNVEVAYKRMYCLQVDERITGGLISGRRRGGGVTVYSDFL